MSLRKQRRYQELEKHLEAAYDARSEVEQLLTVTTDPTEYSRLQLVLKRHIKNIERLEEEIEQLEAELSALKVEDTSGKLDQTLESEMQKNTFNGIDNDQRSQEEKGKIIETWQRAGEAQAKLLPKGNRYPSDIKLACAIYTFLSQQKEANTRKIYQANCHNFCLYLNQKYSPEVKVIDLSIRILDDYFIWLMGQKGVEKLTAVNKVNIGPRSLFVYLAKKHNITPGGVNLSHLVANIGNLSSNSRDISQVDYNAIVKLVRYMLEKQALANDQLFIAGRSLSPKEKQNKTLGFLRDRAIILTLYSTGMNLTQLYRLNQGFLRDGSYYVIDQGKDGKKKEVRIKSLVARQAIKEYLEARNDKYEPLFIQHTLKPINDSSKLRLSVLGFWNSVRYWGEKIGIAINPLDFRHAYTQTSALLYDEMSPQGVAQLINQALYLLLMSDTDLSKQAEIERHLNDITDLLRNDPKLALQPNRLVVAGKEKKGKSQL